MPVFRMLWKGSTQHGFQVPSCCNSESLNLLELMLMVRLMTTNRGRHASTSSPGAGRVVYFNGLSDADEE